MFFKYACYVIYLVGLAFFGLYTNLCEINDLFYSHISKRISTLHTSYDYIVVGAGSAGSVVALRLAEDANSSVLLLEAGSYGGRLLDIPILSVFLHKSLYDWKYTTMPQKNACNAFENNACYWPMGKIVGGTGRLNNMLYTRGHENDFNEWYKDLPGYNYEDDVLTYFKKAENQVERHINDTKYHSTRGPLIANGLPFVSELFDAAMEAAKSLGFPVRDINGKYNSGFFQPQANIQDGARYSTGHHLLLNKRPNLTIKTHSIVEKVLLRSNYEAYAVKVSNLGETFTVRARKGVILTAGVIGSPKILMLSGIGVKSHLDEVGIKTKIDLPVGDNLQDHVGTGFDLVKLARPLSFSLQRLVSPRSIAEYVFTSSGPMTSTGCDALALLNTDCLDSGFDYDNCENGTSPNLELFFMPVALTTDYGFRSKDIIGVKDDMWNDYFAPLFDQNAINLLGVNLHPKSLGTVRLKDKNPQSKPIIDPKYLSHPHDVEILLKAIDFVKRLLKTEAFVELGAKMYEAKFPGCENFEFDSPDYWKCYIKHVSFTLYHPVGTCRMGHDRDPRTVVNYDFQVLGTNNLYVADGSTIPSLTSANTNAAVVMIAEKVASIIKHRQHLMENVCNGIEIFIPKIFC